MKKIKTKFKDLIVFHSKSHFDSRGYFRELVLEKEVKTKLKFYVVSKSKKNVLRGLHFQKKRSQGKFLSVLKGEIFDVALDCRPGSKTFGKHFKIFLSEKNCKSIYIPPGFAHGFLGMKEENIVMYGCTQYRDAKSESGIIWNDPNLSIDWGINESELIISPKDRELSFLNEIDSPF